MKQVMGKWLALVAGVVLAGAAAAQPVGSTVRVQTDRGPIDIQLYDQAAPATVTNFLNYVRRGAYDGTVFHRLEKGFVLQGGGYLFQNSSLPRMPHISTDAPIALEASTSRSNLRGTVAMARTDAPHSATSEWYINLADNKFLDPSGSSAGYAVFGRVSAPSLATVEALGALVALDARPCYPILGPYLQFLPLTKALSSEFCSDIRSDQLLVKRSVKVLPAPATLSDTDRVLNYLEALYPQYATPASSPTATWEGYTYRAYANGTYVGTKDGWVHYLVPALSRDIQKWVPLAELLQQAAAAGY